MALRGQFDSSRTIDGLNTCLFYTKSIKATVVSTSPQSHEQAQPKEFKEWFLIAGG